MGIRRAMSTGYPAGYAGARPSTTPAWLPAGAVVYADFVNGNYYANGAETKLSDLFEQVASWGTYTAADVEAGGLTTGYPVLKTTPAADLLAGFTAVVDFTLAASGTQQVNVSLIKLPEFSPWLGFDTDLAMGARARDADSGTPVSSPATFAAGAHKAAVTLTPTKYAVSGDGAAVASSATTIFADPTHVALWADGGTMQSIAFYVVKDDAELATLSAVS